MITSRKLMILLECIDDDECDITPLYEFVMEITDEVRELEKKYLGERNGKDRN